MPRSRSRAPRCSGRGRHPVAPTCFAASLDDRVHEPYRESSLVRELRAELPAGARGATLSGSGPTVIVWADDAATLCERRSKQRYPEHRVLALAVSPRGAHA